MVSLFRIWNTPYPHLAAPRPPALGIVKLAKNVAFSLAISFSIEKIGCLLMRQTELFVQLWALELCAFTVILNDSGHLGLVFVYTPLTTTV